MKQNITPLPINGGLRVAKKGSMGMDVATIDKYMVI